MSNAIVLFWNPKNLRGVQKGQIELMPFEYCMERVLDDTILRRTNTQSFILLFVFLFNRNAIQDDYSASSYRVLRHELLAE